MRIGCSWHDSRIETDTVFATFKSCPEEGWWSALEKSDKEVEDREDNRGGGRHPDDYSVRARHA